MNHVLLDEALLRAVNELPEGLEPLQVAKRLGAFSPGARRAGSELHELRSRARPKFPHANRTLLTRKGLEQSSSIAVANARAARFLPTGGTPTDLTAGLGADAIALGSTCGAVLAGDIDSTTTSFLAHNLASHDIRALVFRGRAEHPATRDTLLHLDPDRRARETDRRGRLEQHSWQPAWNDIERLTRCYPGGDIKLHPLLKQEDVPPLKGIPHSWQWVSERGDSKETTLWFGALAGTEGQREVLALGSWGAAHWASAAEPPPEPADSLESKSPDWLATCDPALRRSDLHGALARSLGWRPLFAGATTYAAQDSPQRGLWRPLRVLDATRADPRQVHAMLERHGIGPVDIRKDGVRESAGELAARFRGRGNRRGTLLVAALPTGYRAFLVEEPPA